MSDHVLPEDSNLWPRDPFDLLGVERDADPIQARRSYLRLVRMFKPERHPEAFQRLRAAYEQVKSVLEWHQTLKEFSEPPEDSPWQIDESDSNEVASDERAETDAASCRGSRRARPNQLDELWQEFKNGNYLRAYQGLMAIRYASSNPIPSCLRLYWILRTHPELDRERTARDWLVEGSLGHPIPNKLTELYRRELLVDPAEAATARCRSLIDRETRHFQHDQILQWRWQGLFRTGRWELIVEDVERMRDRFKFDEEKVWLEVLALALHHLAWFQTGSETAPFRLYRMELGKLPCDSQEFESVLDRVDALDILLPSWERLRLSNEIPTEWIELMPYEWLGLSEIVTPNVIALMQSIVDDPATTLQQLDRLRQISPMGFSSIYKLLCSHKTFQPAERSFKEADAIVAQFLTLNWVSFSYQALRQELLRFCIREAISPDEIARSCERLAETGIQTLNGSAEFYDDLPLRAVYVARETLEM
jgi:hypothetical protein